MASLNQDDNPFRSPLEPGNSIEPHFSRRLATGSSFGRFSLLCAASATAAIAVHGVLIVAGTRAGRDPGTPLVNFGIALSLIAILVLSFGSLVLGLFAVLNMRKHRSRLDFACAVLGVLVSAIYCGLIGFVFLW